ncbi:hydrogenase-4 subunit G [Leptospira perolatii]|uniref:Hydrogenase-4 subunit G n=1 Tax=Leptospira perolatii TaxID=2023191 RepID=A0A2M9ZSH7_9LEPT|nr:4Fe-4S dicluster domain-containing protein [Leptospira perolatii]PJZ71515.1 hydrogenase-4 subunit G [Leptospira perolatii]PJZ75048.1 hydrogenase-4 subunit G [Leptospira perolatii]
MAIYEIVNFFKKPATLNYKKPTPVHGKARGVPVPVKNGSCEGCSECVSYCPTKAIALNGSQSKSKLVFDYGACLQCGLCVEICPNAILENSGLIYAFTLDREELVVEYENGVIQENPSKPLRTNPFEVQETKQERLERREEFKKLTHRKGLNYREVAACGNNTVEAELNASFNNVFDSESEGVRSVASPKHADVLLYSGPVSDGMRGPLAKAWDTMPDPKALVACGTEAISGGSFERGIVPREPDLYIPGDPPRPDTILQGLRLLMGRLDYSFRKELQKVIELRKKKN